LTSRDEVRSTGQKDIRNKSLRISIVERKPAALDLHHNAVAFEKSVIVRVQVD
jgi:hypothetical protein